MAFIPLPESGITSNSSRNIGLDAGVVWGDINLPLLLAPPGGQEWNIWSLAKTTPWSNYQGTKTPFRLGATRGGVGYNPGRTERQIEADGRRTNIVGWQRIDMSEPTVKVNMLESRNTTVMKQYFGSHAAADYGYYTRLQHRLVVQNDEYFGNIVVAQFVAGSPLPILYILNNARANTADELTTTDKGETVLSVTFVGHTLEDDPFGDTLGAGEVWIPQLYTS